MKTENIKTTRVEEVSTTPFTLFVETETIENETIDKIHVCLGNQEVCQHTFSSTNDAYNYIKEKPWMLISAFVITAVQKMLEYERENKGNTKTD